MNVLAQASRYWNYTDDELLGEARYSNDPLTHELAERLEEIPDLRDEIAALETQLDALETQLDEGATTPDEDADDREHEWDAERDRLEEEIRKLNEQLAHEEGRVEAFYEENKGLRDEIACLKKEGTPNMTDELLEKLLERLESLETVVIALTFAMGDAATAPRKTRKAKAVETETASEPAAREPAPAPEPTPEPEPEPKPTPAAPELTIANLQAALTRLAGSNGAKACKDLVGQYSTTGVLSGVTKEKYPALFAAAEALIRPEAA